MTLSDDHTMIVCHAISDHSDDAACAIRRGIAAPAAKESNGYIDTNQPGRAGFQENCRKNVLDAQVKFGHWF